MEKAKFENVKECKTYENMDLQIWSKAFVLKWKQIMLKISISLALFFFEKTILCE